MLRWIIYGLLFSSSIVLSQNRKFYDRLDRTERDSIVERPATANKIRVIDFDQGHYSDILLHEINSIRKKRGRNPFVQDSVFNQVANTSVKHFPINYFRKNRYAHKIIRHTERGIKHLKGNNRLFHAYTYNINLTALKAYNQFYYLSKDESSEMKLFMGRRPRFTNPDAEDYKEPVAVEALTEQGLVDRILKKMLRASGGMDLLSKHFTDIGLYMRVDEYTLNRRKIPKAFVMVVVGGKQTQKVKEYNPIDRNANDADNPYVILK